MGQTAFPIPRGNLRCKQVSRLGFILLAHLPTGPGGREKACPLPPWPAVASSCVRRLHGYWDSPEISSAFPWRQGGNWQPFPSLPSRIAAQIHRLFICRFDYTMRNRERQETAFFFDGKKPPLRFSAKGDAFDAHWLMARRSASTAITSAGSQATESSSAGASHRAASCSFRVR